MNEFSDAIVIFIRRFVVEFPFDGFSDHTCKSLVAMLDVSFTTHSATSKLPTDCA